MVTLIFFSILAFIVLLKCIVVVKPDHRGVINRLGRTRKVIGPGFHLHYPFIEVVKIVDLNAEIRGWQTYSPKDLEIKVEEIATFGKDLKIPKTINKRIQSSEKATSNDLETLISKLVEIASNEIGVSLARDELAKTRIAEAAQKAIEEIKLNGQSTIELPFLTADASGPKHFRMDLDSRKIKELTSYKS